MESDAFKALLEISATSQLDPLVKEVLRVAGTVEPRPASINRDLVLRAAEHLDIPGRNLETEQGGLGQRGGFSEDLEAQLELVSDPTVKLGTTAELDDFIRSFDTC